jgi:hypothetical protein
MTEPAATQPTSDRQHPAQREPRLALVILLAGIVVTFRVAAYLAPSRFVAIPDSLRLPLCALGLLFLACGIWAWRVRPSAATRAFLVYGAGMGIHWGGTVGAASPTVETALLVVYAAATAAGDGALLDLALRFPRSEGRPARTASAVYLLALATLLAASVTAFLPRRALEVGLGVLFMASLLISITAVIGFIAKWLRATPSDRSETGLTPIVAALLVAGVANLLGDAGVLPGPPQAWGLPYAFVPLTLAWALTRER